MPKTTVKKEATPVKSEPKTKKTTKKTEAVEQTAPVKEAKKDTVKRASPLSVPVVTLKGQEEGTLSLPKEVFGQKVNKQLIAQAVRVYSTNLQGHYSSTKTRGEVSGSTRKIYRQKGTGGARHGSIKAPIYVGGGIALGPKPRKTLLDLPKKMKKMALISALSQRAKEQHIAAVADLDKASGKTKQMAAFLAQFMPHTALVVADKPLENVSRSVRNVPGVDFTTVDQLNTFTIINHQNLIFTPQAVEKLQEKVTKEGK